MIVLKQIHETKKVKYGVVSNYRPLFSKLLDVQWASFCVVSFFNKLMSKIRAFNLYMLSHGYNAISFEIGDKSLLRLYSLNKDCKNSLLVVANNAMH